MQYALSVVHISFGVDRFILRRRTPLHMMCENAIRCQYSFTLNYRDVSSVAHDMHTLCNNVLQCTVRGPHLFLAAWPGAAPETGGRIHLLQCINAIGVCPLYVQCNPEWVHSSTDFLVQTSASCYKRMQGLRPSANQWTHPSIWLRALMQSVFQGCNAGCTALQPMMPS